MTIGRLRLASFVVAAALAVVLTGCSSGSTGSTPATSAGMSSTVAVPAPAGTTITATNFSFGAPITVAPGATVTFVNSDESRHNVTADDKSFSSATVTKATTTFTAPSTPGTYAFHCTIHPTMHGSLIVK